MRKLFILVILMGMAGYCVAQKQIQQYEYWFDDNYTAKTLVNTTAAALCQLTASVPTTALPSGLHTFQIRFKDNTGLWSSSTSQFFIKIPSYANQHHQLTKYEYWFDNDNANTISQTITAQDSVSLLTSIFTGNLPKGLHTFHIRFQDNTGLWSSSATQFFIKPAINDSLHNKIRAYRYWFNTGFANQLITEVNPLNPLNLDSLIIPVTATKRVTPNNYLFNPDPTNGLKITYFTPTLFNIQFKDIQGQWSSTSIDTVGFRYTVGITCDTLHSNAPKTKLLPSTDSIHFFTLNALTGDSLIFKTNKALIIDIFDTYGLKIKTITASESTIGKGVRAKLDGAYFVLVHGFGAASGNYTITYKHIAKYAVLAYTPHKVGNMGTSLIRLEGNGFSSSTIVTLVKDTITLTSDTVLCSSLSSLIANFNFDSVPVGLYNIKVDFGDTIIIISNGIEVESVIPSHMNIEIIGPSSVRSGMPASYIIRCTNTGNMQIESPTIVVAIDSDDPNFTVSCNTYLDEKIKKYCDSVNIDIKKLCFIKSPNLLGHNNRECKKGMFFFPTIPAYSAFELVVSVKTIGNSSISAWQVNVTKNDILAAISQGLDTTQNYPSQLKSALINWNENCIAKSINCLVSLTLGVWGSSISTEQIIQTVCNTVAGQLWTAATYLNGNHENLGSSLGILVGGSLIGMGLIIGAPEGFLIAAAITSGIVTGINCGSAIIECMKPNTSPQIDITSVSSRDPNDKIGYRSPSGSLSFNAAKNNFTYIINFENKDSATAPAQEVWIIDTLNTNLIDIKSFKAGYIKIGNRVVQAPYNAQNHTWEVDMRPAMNLRAKVQLTLDTTSGIARWYFKSINPLTEALPTDPFSGFLPPNDSTGRGQGSVSFSINLKDSLLDGTSINNRASIVFDYNNAIITPTWTNTMDITKPISFVSPLPAYTASDSIHLQWHGTDTGSGILSYAIYASINGGNYALWQNTHDSTGIFIGAIDSTYRFYSIATDSAGNIESAPLIYDAITTVCHIPIKATLAVGLDTVCANTNLVYTSSSNYANKYVWNIYPSSAGFTNDTTSSVNIHWNKRYSGLARIYVKGTNECGIGDYSDTLAIIVNPLPDSAQQITGLASVCQGQNNVLYKVPAIANATSYTWTLPTGASGTSSTDTIVINYGTSAVSGNITVKGHNFCGDGDSSSISITVNPLPSAAGTISGLTTVCQGQSSVTYKIPTIANATSYTWALPTGATGTSSIDSIVVSYGTSAISGNITVKGNNSCGIGDSSLLSIMVNPLPVNTGIISGDSIVCQEQNAVTYTIPSIANATSYIWTLPSGASGTSDSNSITVNYAYTAMSGYVTVKAHNGCGNSALASLPINIKPSPLISFATNPIVPITGCEPLSIAFTNTSAPSNSSYVWDFGDGQTSTVESPTHVFSAGNYAISLTATTIYGCFKTLLTYPNLIVIHPIPTTPVITQNVNTLSSSANSGNQWFNLSIGIINNATAQTYLPQQIGDYFTIVTLNGCSSDSSNIIHYDDTGVDIVESNDAIKVYPNPVSNELIIEIKGNKNKLYFEILNSIGQVVYKGNIIEKTIVQTNHFAKGVYLIKLENGKTYEFKKIVKE